MIRRAGIEDINNIIKLHLRSFGKNHFSAIFNEKLLKKYFTKLIRMNEYCFVYFDTEESELQSYLIAGFNTSKAVNSFTNENLFPLIITLLKNPSFILEKISELYKKVSEKTDKKRVKCRLYLISVDEKHKGKGIGNEITKHLEDELRNDGIDVYGLSVRKDNKSAIGFYKKSGYTFDFENSKSIYYLKNI